MKRFFGITTISKSIRQYLANETGPTGSLSHLGIKAVQRYEKFRLPRDRGRLDEFFPQLVISFGGWKPRETILNGHVVQGHSSFNVSLLTNPAIDAPSGPDSTEMLEQVAELFIQDEQLRAPVGMWSPSPDAPANSLPLEQYQKGIEIASVFPLEIYPVSDIGVDGLSLDQQTFPLAVVGDSYKR